MFGLAPTLLPAVLATFLAAAPAGGAEPEKPAAGQAEEQAAEPAGDFPEMPAPRKEHEWLSRFVGEWESTAEVTPVPGQPAMKCQGKETVRSLGGFWILAEGKSEMPGGGPFTHIMTLGYDAEKGKYVGTWVDSMSGYLWKYEGEVDPTGNILTLYSEGPCPLQPGKIFKFKEVTEFKSKDHRVGTASMQDEDGEWTTFMTGHSRRKK
jgi:hypothetical protein